MAEMKNLTINGTPFTLPFAPAGYGLGERVFTEDFNTCLANGWYFGNAATANPPANFTTNCACFVVARTATQIYQYFFYPSNGCVMQRYTKDGGATWVEEWINPPMEPGVEYRTTERWAGKAVYTKLVNVVSAGVGTTSIQHGIAMTQCLECKACESGNDTLPMKYAYGTTDIVKNAYANNAQIIVYTDSEITNLHCTLKYTKD